MRPLDQDQEEHQKEKATGEPNRCGWVPEREPGSKDPGRKGGHAEVPNGSVFVQHLHEDERDPGDDGRSRHRERHPQERFPRGLPEDLGGLEDPAGLLHERGPRNEVDVRVEGQGEDHAGSGKRHEAGSKTGRGRRIQRDL